MMDIVTRWPPTTPISGLFILQRVPLFQECAVKRIHIFKPGRQVDSHGQAIDFSEAVLQDIAASYDPSLHEAPLVVGHPSTNGPAYGWVKRLRADSGLQAEPYQVDPAFAELVEAGRYKKVSASFYLPDSPANPKPGSYYLRHVGFLGAAPPAVKGLRPIEFSSSAEGVVEFSWEAETNAGLWRRLKNWLIGDKGQQVADEVLPEWQIESLRDAAIREEVKAELGAAQPTGSDMSSYTEKESAMTKELEALAARERLVEQRERALKELERAASLKGHSDFAEGLVRDGKLIPAHQKVIVGVLAELPTGSTLEFSEGGKVVQQNLQQAFKDLLKGLPKVVEFRELATGPTPAQPTDDPREILARALEFQEKAAKRGEVLSIADAVTAITKENA
jgi:hypothetical protein